MFLQLLSIRNNLQLLFHLLVPPDAHTDNADTDNKLQTFLYLVFRNFGFGWQNITDPAAMCKHNNPGTGPFSEPETRAVKVADRLLVVVLIIFNIF